MIFGEYSYWLEDGSVMLTSPLAIRCRTVARKIGLTRVLSALLSRGSYEDRFGQALLAAILPGDIVWDIGANVGFYTEVFVEKVGDRGRVVAFEPTAECFEVLCKKFAGDSRVIVHEVALGASDGKVSMVMEPQALAATHRIVLSGRSNGPVIEVPIRSALSMVREFPDCFPTVVKIDVEGHEGAVIDGFSSMLMDERLRCIGIELHFGLLDERGEPGRPKEIEQTLTAHGFKIRWTDPSHLLAMR